MTYLHQINPDQEAELAPLISSFDLIKPGQSFQVKDRPDRIQRLRYLFYSWLAINNLKPLARVRRTSQGFSVEKLEPTGTPTVILEGESPGENFFKDQLIEIEQKSQALSLVRSSGLEPSEQLIAIERWEKFNA